MSEKQDHLQNNECYMIIFRNQKIIYNFLVIQQKSWIIFLIEILYEVILFIAM